jgi:hypothetical protein
VCLLGSKKRAGLLASSSAGPSELGLAEFLAQGARGHEGQVRLVAQTLINILPDEDAERRLREGFLAGRDMSPESPRQERLF